MSFIQLVEFRTKHIDEVEELLEGWLAESDGERTSTRGVQARDRDHADTYLSIIEFPSYEDAMKNSELPTTSAFAKRMASLCDGQPTFRNLDVIRDEGM